MFKSVWNDIVDYFRTGNIIARIILINIAIFVGVNIMSVFMTGGLGPNFNDFLKQISQIKKMGNLKDVVGMIPGMGKAMKGFINRSNSQGATFYSMAK